MRRIVLPLLVLIGALLLIAGSASGRDSSGGVYGFTLDGEIDPAASAWVNRALDQAENDGSSAVLIRLDTPGGLIDSLRDIVQSIIDSPLPVIVYVSPDGARAGSAGAYITEAADVAAMSAQSNIGSATPIEANGADIGDTLGQKITNDSAAYMRALAESHGRDGELAGTMVTDAANFTANEALDQNLIDVVADDSGDLLDQADGFQIQGPKEQMLKTSGLEVIDHDMPFELRVLALLVNPTIAFLLLIVGIVGIGLELLSPGLVLPGTLGSISFVLGVFGSSQLPVTVIGVMLLAVGLVLMIAEAHFATHGLLGIAAVLAIVVGGLLLFNTGGSDQISVPVVVIAGVVLGAGFLFLANKALEARRAPVQTGAQGLVGASAEVRSALEPEGQVFVKGALWRARLAEGGTQVLGDRVRIRSVEGLTLVVDPEPSDPTNPAKET